ncbi:GNAT family protein [Lactobacillus sp. ESL0785]|uniref:GNAT family N-acetyltransferase n=1 Tax=Lactobacillus sp. ESL0785 TaxID=2983232 RepID=UPI0023FA08B7|nr:GNAT family protein [Lactobacillus sp. ESL0785]WEV71165.1 GNAT family protein [Lactobacillus sp. ESL0785]
MFVLDEFMINALKIKLVLPELNQASAMLNLIAKDRAELGRWLPWAQSMQKVTDEEEFIKLVRQKTADYTMLELVILVNEQVAGMIDIHNLNSKNQCGEIGYWLGSAFQKQGIMTQAVAHLIKIAFTKMKVHRLNLLADHENNASRAVAQRAGLTHVALLHDEVKYHGEFRDMDLYTIINEA